MVGAQFHALLEEPGKRTHKLHPRQAGVNRALPGVRQPHLCVNAIAFSMRPGSIQKLSNV